MQATRTLPTTFFPCIIIALAHGPLSAIIVQLQVHAIIVQVQTLFVNFVIANSIQVTIISIIALTCLLFFSFFFFFSCHALETALLTRLFAVHTHKWQLPSRAVHVAAKI